MFKKNFLGATQYGGHENIWVGTAHAWLRACMKLSPTNKEASG